MSVTAKKKTAYGVFIIESLRKGDVHDAKIMQGILEMSDIVTIYEYVETVAQFENQLEEFKKSNFRYLHLSFHADETGLEIEGEDYSNKRLADLLSGGMDNKRLFMSTCKGANRNLAKKIITGSGAMSLCGSPTDFYFDKAVLFWPSFYHLMREIDVNAMTKTMIVNTLQKCTDLFGVPINYYSKIKSMPKSIRRLKIRTGKQATRERIDFK